MHSKVLRGLLCTLFNDKLDHKYHDKLDKKDNKVHDDGHMFNNQHNNFKCLDNVQFLAILAVLK